jgi:hypothetical protein
VIFNSIRDLSSDKLIKQRAIPLGMEDDYYLRYAELYLSILKYRFKGDVNRNLAIAEIFEGYKTAYERLHFTKFIYWFQNRRIEHIYQSMPPIFPLKDLPEFPLICIFKKLDSKTIASLSLVNKALNNFIKEHGFFDHFRLNERYTSIILENMGEECYTPSLTGRLDTIPKQIETRESVIAIRFDNNNPELAIKIIGFWVVVPQCPPQSLLENNYWFKASIMTVKDNGVFINFKDYVGFKDGVFNPYNNPSDLFCIECPQALKERVKRLAKNLTMDHGIKCISSKCYDYGRKVI